MKKCLFLTVALTLSVFSLFTTSCDNNDEPNVSKPVATLAEVGEENSKTATAGKDMHLEGNLEAEGLIARIDVAVTSADGLTTVFAKSWTDGKYIGVRNTTFHEHIDISSETAAGEYVLTFTVTDKAGQSSVFKSSLKITTPVEGSPEITITETGEGNSKTAVAGGEMHLEAEISAPNKKTATAGKDMHLEGNLEAEGLIARIDVAVTSADGLTTVFAKSWTDGKYIGVRNTTFHEHIDISSETAAGEYVLTFTVTDKAGQSSVFKSSLKITTPVEGSPEITITETGEGNSKTAVAGGEMHLEAEISAPNKIAEIEVELHNTAADYEKEFKYTGKYLGETSAHFHEHLAVPADAPAGEYHLHFTVTDADGNSTTEEVEGIQITK